MNTEAMNTLKQIRDALSILQNALNKQSLSPGARNLLEKAVMNITDLEDIIINNILKAMVEKINSSNEQLKKLIDDMEESKEKIAKFSNTVKKISDVVGVLAEITSKAISAGIV